MQLYLSNLNKIIIKELVKQYRERYPSSCIKVIQFSMESFLEYKRNRCNQDIFYYGYNCSLMSQNRELWNHYKSQQVVFVTALKPPEVYVFLIDVLYQNVCFDEILIFSEFGKDDLMCSDISHSDKRHIMIDLYRNK